MDKVIIDLREPTRWEKFKMAVSEKANAAVTWCREHKEVLMVVVPAVISGGVELTKAYVRAKDHKEDRELEEKRLSSVYDRSAGMYLDVKHPLSNDEWREVQRRKRDGMTTGEALDDMGLLT